MQRLLDRELSPEQQLSECGWVEAAGAGPAEGPSGDAG